MKSAEEHLPKFAYSAWNLNLYRRKLKYTTMSKEMARDTDEKWFCMVSWYWKYKCYTISVQYLTEMADFEESTMNYPKVFLVLLSSHLNPGHAFEKVACKNNLSYEQIKIYILAKTWNKREVEIFATIFVCISQ